MGELTALNKEGKHVAGNEDLREPLLAYERVCLAIGEEYDAAEDNVDGGGEESGCDEEEERLYDEGTEFPLVEVRHGAADVAYEFNCAKMLLVNVALGTKSRCRTCAADHKWYEIPCSFPTDLEDVVEGGESKKYNENDRRG